MLFFTFLGKASNDVCRERVRAGFEGLQQLDVLGTTVTSSHALQQVGTSLQ